MTQDRLRVASLGLGWVTMHRHVPWVQRNPRMKLVGVIDRRSGRPEAVAQRLHLTHHSEAEDAGAVPWLGEIDAVTIGTPPRTHHQLAGSYLRAGKHVLLEKPMAMTVAEAEDLRALADAHAVTLCLVHNFQFASSIRRLLTLIAGGQLGEVKSVWATQLSNHQRRLPDWYEDLPLGLFYDESPHFFYLLRAVMGPGVAFEDIRVVPSTEGRNTPHRVSASLHANGINAQLDMCFESPVSEWQLMVLGSEKVAVVDVFRDILVVLPNDGQHTARDIITTTVHGVTGHLMGTVQSGLRMVRGRLAYGNDIVIEQFRQACVSGMATPGMGSDDGVEVVRLMNEVVAAAS